MTFDIREKLSVHEAATRGYDYRARVSTAAEIIAEFERLTKLVDCGDTEIGCGECRRCFDEASDAQAHLCRRLRLRAEKAEAREKVLVGGLRQYTTNGCPDCGCCRADKRHAEQTLCAAGIHGPTDNAHCSWCGAERSGT